MAGLGPDLPNHIQIISGESEFYDSKAQGYIKRLTEKYADASTHYSVISIIGPQSSGKSYLLNKLFGTNFAVLQYGSRNRTTNGIWIAGCIDPCMIIMDIEGCDGMERGEDNQFEKRSALFALRVSDILMINMNFTAVGLHHGANADLIKFLFKKIVEVEAPNKITNVVVVIRDHDYNQLPPDTVKELVQSFITELWHKEHPASTNRKMSDYIMVYVFDFPNYQAEENFARKSKDLANAFCNFARSANLKPKNNFAHNSKVIWGLICQDKWIIASKNEPELAAYVSKKIKDDILKSLEYEEGYKSLRSGKFNSVKEFNKKLSTFLTRILDRYEAETIAFSVYHVRKEQKDELERIIVNGFQSTFEGSVWSLVDKIQTSAKSDLYDQLDKVADLKRANVESAVNEVLQNNYIKVLDANSRADLNSNFEAVLNKCRVNAIMHLVGTAHEAAEKIQMKRGAVKGLKIAAYVVLGTAGAASGGALGAVAGAGIATSVGVTHAVGLVAGAATAGVIIGGAKGTVTAGTLTEKMDKKKA